ncbi:MAG: hypothetical protein AAB681_01020 [Patescibacteria group bacterium]
MKKYMYYLNVMLFMFACNNSKEKRPDSATQNYTADTTAIISSTPKPKQGGCVKVLRNNEVHNAVIYFDNFETGTGGVYKEKDGNWYLLTASHIFPKGRVGYYSTITGKDTLYVAETIFNKDDGVIMKLSPTKNRFEGFSLFKNDGSQKSGWTMEMMFKQVGGQKIFSLCGAEYAHIGYLVNEPSFIYAGLIVRKPSVSGESGTVFYDEDENIYVMSQQYLAGTNETYFRNGIKENEQMSLLRPIGFGIKISETGVKTSIPW